MLAYYRLPLVHRLLGLLDKYKEILRVGENLPPYLPLRKGRLRFVAGSLLKLNASSRIELVSKGMFILHFEFKRVFF